MEKHCQHCKSTEKELYKNSKYGYMCKDCNTERVARYRATAEGREKIYEALRRSNSKPENWIKILARQKVAYHLRKGNIVRPELCPACSKAEKLFAHHKDYTKALEIIWLCLGCHRKIHKNCGKTVNKDHFHKK